MSFTNLLTAIDSVVTEIEAYIVSLAGEIDTAGAIDTTQMAKLQVMGYIRSLISELRDTINEVNI